MMQSQITSLIDIMIICRDPSGPRMFSLGYPRLASYSVVGENARMHHISNKAVFAEVNIVFLCKTIGFSWVHVME